MSLRTGMKSPAEILEILPGISILGDKWLKNSVHGGFCRNIMIDFWCEKV